MRRLSVTAAVFASLFAAGNAAASTFYVSAGGSDTNAGTSATAAWRTVGKVNAAALAPGDRVLFQGGQTFSDATLMPSASGSAGAPITFASFGTGQATISNTNGAVWFSGKRYLTFDNLGLTSAGSSSGVFAGSGGGASDHIVLSNSTVSNGAGVGLIAPNAGDSAWTISGNDFSNIGDSGLILQGAGHSVVGNTIADVGTNPAITYGKHGIYAKAADLTISGNDISHVTSGQAVSIRLHGARIFGNTIHDTPYAFGFFDYDTAPAPQGTSYIYSNRAWNISGYGLYYDSQADPNGHAPTVDIVFASNTFSFSAGSEAINVAPSVSAHVSIFNNIFAGSYGSALRAAPTTTAHHNDWFGGTSNVPAGAGDMTVAPAMAGAPAFTLPITSLLVDRGTTSAVLAYSPTCDGSPLSYCGTMPDIGASEAASAAPVSAPAPAPAPTTPTPTPTPSSPLAPPTELVAQNVGQTALTLSWTASTDTRTVGYRVTQNGVQIASPSGTTLPLSGLSCGTSFNFTVTALDASGTASPTSEVAASTAACVDTTPPTVSFATPSAGSTVGLKFSFAASAADASGIAEVNLFVDGVARCRDVTPPYYCSGSVSRGWHLLKATAIDRNGNSTTVTEWVYASTGKRSLVLYAASSARHVHKPTRRLHRHR
jgi:hypothetical protein